jgi:hypothetical protein
MRRGSGAFAPLAGGSPPGGSPPGGSPPGTSALNSVIDRPSFSRFEAELQHARSVNTVAEVAQRFHREGLPIARLWESHRALLSLGLNQRGKPGLWLVQKTH